MYSNPYSQADFFSFFALFFQRAFGLLIGRKLNIASDELQLFTLSAIAIASGLVGVFLVLRRMTMLANALSHTTLIGIAAVYLFLTYFQIEKNSAYLFIIGAVTTAIITSFCTEFLTKVLNVQEDASIGLVFSTLFAAGIVIITLFARNAHIGTELIMGNVDTLQREDLTLALSVFGLNSLFIIAFYKELKIATFDPFLSSTFGISPSLFKLALTVMTSATTMCAFKAVGVLMVLAFLTAPVLIARLFTHSLLKLLLLSSCIGVFSTFVGVALSRHVLTVFGIGLSTGGIVVCVLVFFYLLALLYAFSKKRVFA